MARVPIIGVGLFDNRGAVEGAIDALRARGIDRSELSVIVPEDVHASGFRAWATQAREDDRPAFDDETVGGTGLAWLAAGSGMALLTAFGPGSVIAAGALIGGVAAATADAVEEAFVGKIARGLTELGMDRDAAIDHERRVQQGAYLLLVDGTRHDPAAIRDLLLRHGADDRATPPPLSGDTGETARPVV